MFVRSPLRDKTNDDAFATPKTQAKGIFTPSRDSAGSVEDVTPTSGARYGRRPFVANDNTPTASKSLLAYSPGPASLLRPISKSWSPVLTVVLDLDETLVSNRRLDLPQAILRPWAIEVLRELRSLAAVEIVLWTASTDDIALPVVDQLQVLGPVFNQCVFRDPTWFTEPYHTKDLRLLGRDMDKVVIIDNAVGCCKLNPGNAVLIEDFTGDISPYDHALVNVYRVIHRLLQGISCGHRVPAILKRMGDEGHLLQKVSFHLPAELETRRHEFPLIQLPAHGDYVKVHTYTQQIPFWGRQAPGSATTNPVFEATAGPAGPVKRTR